MTPKELVFIVSNLSAFQALGTAPTEAITIELTEDQRTLLELKMSPNDHIIMSVHVVKN